MFYRVKQFYLSLTAKILGEDEAFVASYLNIKEQELFFKLQVSDQRHCINVAYDINKHVEERHRDYLIRLALLHDIGKVEAKLTPIDKGMLVILDRLTKGCSQGYVPANHCAESLGKRTNH